MENNHTESRLLYIDNLRIVLIILVVLHHAGQAYGGGWWWYKEMDARIPLLDTFFSVNAAFFMSLFFMISGYFVPASLNRKGVKTFLKERFLRLGIPILFFFLIIIPVQNYFYYLNFRDYGPISFPAYYIDVYFGAGGIPKNWSGPGGGVQIACCYKNESWSLASQLGLSLSYLEERFGNGGALLTPSLLLEGYSRILEKGTLSIELGGVLRSRISDTYLFSWDEAYLYYLASHMIGPAATLEWKGFQKSTLILGLRLPSLGFVGRPYDER